MEAAASSQCSTEAAKVVLGKFEGEARHQGEGFVAAVQSLPGSAIRAVGP